MTKVKGIILKLRCLFHSFSSLSPECYLCMYNYASMSKYV